MRLIQEATYLIEPQNSLDPPSYRQLPMLPDQTTTYLAHRSDLIDSSSNFATNGCPGLSSKIGFDGGNS